MSSSDESEIIYNLACECESLLEKRAEGVEGKSERARILFMEYQQRFAIWASHVGSFSSKSQGLDRRLRDLPELHDLVVRLLDILCRALSQQDRDDAVPIQPARSVDNATQRPSPSSPEPADMMEMIEGTLSRLHELGVTILRFSKRITTLQATKYVDEHDLQHFENMCSFAIQTLYPRAHQELRDRLSQSMVDRYVWIRRMKSRQAALQARRPGSSDRLSIIHEESLGEGMSLSSEDLVTKTAAPNDNEDAPKARRKPKPDASSQSDLTSANGTGTRRNPRHPRTTAHSSRTSSVLANQANYPRPPRWDGEARCEWCTAPLAKEDLEPRKWRQHIDDDFQPYLCLAETCPESFPRFSTTDEWLSHMQTHGSQWYQETFQLPCWPCALCKGDTVFPSHEALLSHIECHSDILSMDKLRAIARQSQLNHTEPQECLLCGFHVEDSQYSDLLAGRKRKRRNDTATATSGKNVHQGLETMPPGLQKLGHVGQDGAEESAAPHDVDSVENDADGWLVSRHISGHLRSLMLLTIRLVALQMENEADPGGDTQKSDIGDIVSGIDNGGSPPGNDGIGKAFGHRQRRRRIH